MQVELRRRGPLSQGLHAFNASVATNVMPIDGGTPTWSLHWKPNQRMRSRSKSKRRQCQLILVWISL